jgi:hypothetical protein
MVECNFLTIRAMVLRDLFNCCANTFNVIFGLALVNFTVSFTMALICGFSATLSFSQRCENFFKHKFNKMPLSVVLLLRLTVVILAKIFNAKKAFG